MFKQKTQIAEKLCEKEDMKRILKDIGNEYYNIGNHEMAIEYFSKVPWRSLKNWVKKKMWEKLWKI